MKTRSILLVLLLAARCAFAEDHPPKSDASRPVAGGGTPIPFSSATIVSLTPRQQVVLKLTDGTTRSFKLAIPTPCFDKDGALIEGGMIDKDSKVLAHFMIEDGKVLVDRLIVQP
ncbi:MAG TPA: hypothetical protein VGW57_00240 [Chthoniobacterales bacterium]|nr:hypothetical protein [Chthoniobacterales bacterium]